MTVDGTAERAMTPAERAQLEERLARHPSRSKRAIVSAAITAVILAIVFTFVWLVAAALGKRLLQFDYGWNSPAGPWIALAVGLTAVAVAVQSTTRWLRTWKDRRPELRADLARGRVTEERLRITGVKRFQEPEHGGLLYFLRTADDRVFVLFDHESQDLGVDGKDPLTSAFRPHEELALVRAAGSGEVLSQAFSGARLEAPPPVGLDASPKDWPEPEEFCPVPWKDLERTYGS